MPAEKTFTSLLPEALSRRTGRSVEVFNEGMHTGFAGRVELSLNDALDVKPDMILWLLNNARRKRGVSYSARKCSGAS